MGAIGLPGDLSSQSRFRTGGLCQNERPFRRFGGRKRQPVLPYPWQPWISSGAAASWGTDKYEITLYTSCCNADKGIYYYTTYDNHQISGVDMHQENLDGTQLIAYAPVKGEQIYMQN